MIAAGCLAQLATPWREGAPIEARRKRTAKKRGRLEDVMLFGPEILVIGALFLGAVGTATGWLVARVLQRQGARALWVDALLAPLSYLAIVIALEAANAPSKHIDSSTWGLLGSIVSPIAHQATARFCRDEGS